MKRCYFVGCGSVYDSMLAHQMYNELEKIIEKETEIEFWFVNVSTTFHKTCLLLVLKLKKNYPNKDIKIVRIYDPITYSDNIIKKISDLGFPICIPDKNVFSKRLATKEEAANDSNFYMLYDQWIIKNCNYIFTYNYRLLNEKIDKRIKYAQKQSNTTVISFSYDETNQQIQHIAEDLDEQTKAVFHMFYDGKTKKEISKNIGVPYSRITTIIYNGGKYIRQKMANNNIDWKPKDCKCALVGLKDAPSISQLMIFKSVIWFLTKSCRVNEFLIEKKYLYTTYAAMLFQYAYDNNYLNIKIRVIIGSDENKDEWKSKLYEYEPSYSDIISLKSESNDIRSLFEEIIETCDYLATDFTSDEAKLIRGLCMKNSEIDLFDISYKGLTIDDKYVNIDTIND